MAQRGGADVWQAPPAGAGLKPGRRPQAANARAPLWALVLLVTPYISCPIALKQPL